jgi:hypothetical protein
MSKQTTRHYCRNTHCRAKLAAPVDNEHHAFCTSGCHAIFYWHRCLVCEDAMRRKRDDQRFKNGHKTCHASRRIVAKCQEETSRGMTDRPAPGIDSEQFRSVPMTAGHSAAGYT